MGVRFAPLLLLLVPTLAHAGQDGGIVMGVGFGTASIDGGISDRFQADGFGGRTRLGMRVGPVGAELNMTFVSLSEADAVDDARVALLWGPSLSYYRTWWMLDAYVRGGIHAGSISGGERTEVVACEAPEECLTREETTAINHPAYGIELGVGAQLHLARKRRGGHPVVWADWGVRWLRARVDDQNLSGRVRQLAVGISYGREF